MAAQGTQWPGQLILTRMDRPGDKSSNNKCLSWSPKRVKWITYAGCNNGKPTELIAAPY
jgi:hypothetical protein